MEFYYGYTERDIACDLALNFFEMSYNRFFTYPDLSILMYRRIHISRLWYRNNYFTIP
jgi:hypothetical protein